MTTKKKKDVHKQYTRELSKGNNYMYKKKKVRVVILACETPFGT